MPIRRELPEFRPRVRTVARGDTGGRSTSTLLPGLLPETARVSNSVLRGSEVRHASRPGNASRNEDVNPSLRVRDVSLDLRPHDILLRACETETSARHVLGDPSILSVKSGSNRESGFDVEARRGALISSPDTLFESVRVRRGIEG